MTKNEEYLDLVRMGVVGYDGSDGVWWGMMGVVR